MTLLAAFATLLQRHSGSADITVGSPTAGRTRLETEGLIGFFVNTLVLRSDLSGDPGFHELMARVRDVAHGAYAHQDLPFEKLVEELNPDRDLSRHPLFQVAFALQSFEREPLDLVGVSVTPIDVDTGVTQFDLSVFMERSVEGLSARFEYRTDLFDAATIARMMGHFRTILEGIVADPSRRLSELPLLTQPERDELLVEWNDTRTDYPRHSCVNELFETQAEQTPDELAMVFGDHQITYRELNEWANQAGHHLQSLGVGPGSLVAVRMERSIEMVAGVLAILKAGGTYVPLDTSDPPDRLAFMLEDTGARVVLTHERLVDRIPEPGPVVVCLDSDKDVIDRQSRRNLVSGTSAESPAYMMYTSGTMGIPKGVCVPHRAIARLVINTNYVDVQPSDKVALASSPSFDAATFEIWGALLNGARIVGFTQDVVLSPRDFAKQIRAQEISVLWLTATLFNQLAREATDAFSSVRQLLIGGEVVDPKWVGEVLDKAPPGRLINAYGPTESTTFASTFVVENVPEEGQPIPIGRPISNTQIYLLDQSMNPVPIGVPGELCIGGDGVALGYLGRPELTAESFVINPWGDSTSERLYRTGDLARYRPDGNIEFIGRMDDQIKVRGFRVEPREIEAALGRHPTIQETVVVGREDVDDDYLSSAMTGKRLVAYVVPKQGETPTVTELYRFLRTKLSHYMIPSDFVALDALPMTSNGKVDRLALPLPGRARPEQENTFAAPRDPLEFQLTRIWERILGVRPVGIRDNFFELGGHSLVAASLFAEMESILDAHLPLATLFQAPTVEGLAGVLREEGWSPSWSSLVPVQTGGSRLPFFCVHPLGGNVLFSYHLARLLGPGQPIYGLQAQGLDGTRQPLTEIEAMAAHYISEIQTVQPSGPYILGGSSLGGVVAYEMAQQLLEQGQQVAGLVMFDSVNPGFIKARGATAVHRYLNRADVHLRDLRGLGLSGIADYVRERTKRVIRRVKGNIRAAVWLTAHKLYRGFGRPLPPSIQNVGLASIHAVRTYRAKPYRGRISLFRVANRHPGYIHDPDLGWGGLAGGGVEVYEIPGDHVTLWREPNVRVLAQKLGHCLARAQGTDEDGDGDGARSRRVPSDAGHP